MSSLLRVATAGSVDDGKSTLIGRLLFDSKSIFEDQLESVADVSDRMGFEGPNLALLTDGLRAEREQGITIDVAYRYFSTPERTFIIADTPGHIQYTRNMVTGASTADVAVVLVDARKGIQEQSRRHAYIAKLLGVPQLVIAVNKMDLVDYDESVFVSIATEFSTIVDHNDFDGVRIIPISALHGDSVVTQSENMAWYEGPTLLEHLETVEPHQLSAPEHARLPVQYVIRPQSTEYHDYRGYAGQVAAGEFSVGDEIVVLPAGRFTTVQGIDQMDNALETAVEGDSVTLLVADDIDISRGDLIARADNAPDVTDEFEAMVCWFSETQRLEAGRQYLIKHTTRSAKALVETLHSKVDINTLDDVVDADALELNDIGRVTIRTTTPLVLDTYATNRTMGAMILIDPVTNATVGALMVTNTLQPAPSL